MTYRSRDNNDRMQQKSQKQGMISSVILVISHGISNLSADDENGNKIKKKANKKKDANMQIQMYLLCW